jgi:hypothetical protein
MAQIITYTQGCRIKYRLHLGKITRQAGRVRRQKNFISPRDEKLEAVDRKTRKVICLCGPRPLRREYPASRKKAARIPFELGSWIEHLLRVKGITQKEVARETCGRQPGAHPLERGWGMKSDGTSRRIVL